MGYDIPADHHGIVGGTIRGSIIEQARTSTGLEEIQNALSIVDERLSIAIGSLELATDAIFGSVPEKSPTVQGERDCYSLSDRVQLLISRVSRLEGIVSRFR